MSKSFKLKKCVICLIASILLIAITIALYGFQDFSIDTITGIFIKEKYELENFECEKFVVKLIVSITDNGWGRDIMSAEIYNKNGQFIAKSSTIKSISRSEKNYDVFKISNSKNCEFIIVNDKQDDKILMMFDGNTREVWPSHDTLGGDDQKRFMLLKQKLLNKSKLYNFK